MLIIRYLLKFIDFFLPAKPMGRELRARIRILIALILTTFTLSAAANLRYFFQNHSSQLMLFNSLVVISNLIFLPMIKRRDHEWVCLAYIGMILSTNLVSTVRFAPTLLHPAFENFTFLALFGWTIIATRSKRIILVGIILVSTIATVMLIPDPSRVEVEGLDKLGAIEAIFNFTLYTCLLVLSCSAWYAYIKNESDQELSVATDSHLLNLRLEEISSSLTFLVPLLSAPVQRSKEIIQKIDQDKFWVNEDDLNELSREVGLACKTSQSIAWIYRAYRAENIGSTKLEYFASQLKILMEGKFARSEWKIEIGLSDSSYSLSGALPMLALLILTLTESVRASQMDGEALHEISILLNGRPNAFEIKLSWPKGASSFDPEVLDLDTSDDDAQIDFRIDLVKELLQDLSTVVRMEESERRNSVILYPEITESSAIKITV